MTTTIFLSLTCFFIFIVPALGYLFADWISGKIPSAPGATKGANNAVKRLDNYRKINDNTHLIN